MTVQESNSGNFVNFVIGLSLLAFVAMVGLFVLKLIIGLAPIFGVMAAVGGGIWYFQAENDSQKLRALQVAVAGLAVAVLFGAIF